MAALNAGDVDGALALFSDDVKWGDSVVRAYGKEQLRTALDWLIAEEVKQQITDCQPQADRVICQLSRVEACVPASAATDGLPVKLVFVYQPDGKVGQAEAGNDGPQLERHLEVVGGPGSLGESQSRRRVGEGPGSDRGGGLDRCQAVQGVRRDPRLLMGRSRTP